MVKVFEGSSRVLKVLHSSSLRVSLRILQKSPRILKELQMFSQRSSRIFAKVVTIQNILDKITFCCLSHAVTTWLVESLNWGTCPAHITILRKMLRVSEKFKCTLAQGNKTCLSLNLILPHGIDLWDWPKNNSPNLCMASMTCYYSNPRKGNLKNLKSKTLPGRATCRLGPIPEDCEGLR